MVQVIRSAFPYTLRINDDVVQGWSSALQRLKKLAYHLLHILVLTVYGIVHAAHLFLGDFSSKLSESFTDFGMFHYDFIPQNGHGVIRRKIVFVVFQYD